MTNEEKYQQIRHEAASTGLVLDTSRLLAGERS